MSSSNAITGTGARGVVRTVDRELAPVLLDGIEPHGRIDVELARQLSWPVERCLIDDRGTVAAYLDGYS
jgi:hypothetical protein